ncbi:MAG: substrate-binding domain-containing protein [Chitinophagales bacterium]|nr:ABC transporter substrate-binding protein [Bacteroidota bacterium]
MQAFTIGGVPEHFNLPWHIAFENGVFQGKEYSLQWQDIPQGTGAMCKMLREETLDLAVVLTEGIVADIIKGNNARIVQQYVKSPLVWGIHTSYDAPYRNVEELEGKKFAISRFGSGSHIMAYIEAHRRNWQTTPEQFVIVNTLQGGIDALQHGTADIFLWEKYTTKPYVDAQVLRRVGECITPWPCFMLVASEKMIRENYFALEDIAKSIQQSCRAFMLNENAIDMVAWRYKIEWRDAQNWFNQTEWAVSNRMATKMLQNVINTLYNVGIIPNKIAPAGVCSSLCKLDVE